MSIFDPLLCVKKLLDPDGFPKDVRFLFTEENLAIIEKYKFWVENPENEIEFLIPFEEGFKNLPDGPVHIWGTLSPSCKSKDDCFYSFDWDLLNIVLKYRKKYPIDNVTGTASNIDKGCAKVIMWKKIFPENEFPLLSFRPQKYSPCSIYGDLRISLSMYPERIHTCLFIASGEWRWIQQIGVCLHREGFRNFIFVFKKSHDRRRHHFAYNEIDFRKDQIIVRQVPPMPKNTKEENSRRQSCPFCAMTSDYTTEPNKDGIISCTWCGVEWNKNSDKYKQLESEMIYK